MPMMSKPGFGAPLLTWVTSGKKLSDAGIISKAFGEDRMK